jgi:hypothetical protein
MKVTLKNLKHSNALSEETYHFQATVYVGTEKVGLAWNEGHGGSTCVQLDKTHAPFFAKHEDHERLVQAVDDACHQMMLVKQDKALLAKIKRDLAKDILFKRTTTGEGQLRIIKGIVGNKPAYDAKMAALKSDPTVVVIYNLMSAEEACRAMYSTYPSAK